MLVGLLATSVFLASSSEGGSPPASAGPQTVRISGRTPLPDVEKCSGVRDSESEPVLAVDPANPRHLVAAWAQDGERAIVTAVSTNGGSTWSAPSAVAGLTECTGGDLPYVAHPHVAFGAERNTVYLAAMTSDRTTRVEAKVHRSTDGGRTWTAMASPDVGTVLNDFDSFAVEPDTGALVVVWNPAELNVVAEPTLLSRSADGGLTWQRSLVRIAAPGTSGWSDVVPLPDGRLLLTYIDSPLAEFLLGTAAPVDVHAVVSQDKGQSWSSPRRLGSAAALQWPRAEVGSDGTVHVAWIQSAPGRTCSRLGGLSGTPAGGGCEIAVSSSRDAVTWSSPRSLPAWDGEWMPSPGIAANPDGTVTVLHSEPEPGRDTARVLLSTGAAGTRWSTVPAGRVDVPILTENGLYQGATGGGCGPLAVAALTTRDSRGRESTEVHLVRPRDRNPRGSRCGARPSR